MIASGSRWLADDYCLPLCSVTGVHTLHRTVQAVQQLVTLESAFIRSDRWINASQRVSSRQPQIGSGKSLRALGHFFTRFSPLWLREGV